LCSFFSLWIPGKLPFYVAPEGFEIPKSRLEEKKEEVKDNNEVKVADDDETKSVATAVSQSVIKGRELKQLQDFRKIKVNLEFEPEDIKELDLEGIKEYEEAKKQQGDRKKRKYDDEEEESSGISDFYSEDEFDEEQNKVVHRNAGTKIKTTPKGKKQKTTTGFFKVEDVSEPKKEKVVKKVTAKQRRAIERKEKPKKVGSNFYDVVNVKNKTKSRKFAGN